MNDVLPLLLLIGIAGAALTALWNGYEARQLRGTREWEEDVLDDLKVVVNGNADVLIDTVKLMNRLQGYITVLEAKSELYYLALSIRKDYPNPSEEFDVIVQKIE